MLKHPVNIRLQFMRTSGQQRSAPQDTRLPSVPTARPRTPLPLSQGLKVTFQQCAAKGTATAGLRPAGRMPWSRQSDGRRAPVRHNRTAILRLFLWPASPCAEPAHACIYLAASSGRVCESLQRRCSPPSRLADTPSVMHERVHRATRGRRLRAAAVLEQQEGDRQVGAAQQRQRRGVAAQTARVVAEGPQDDVPRDLH